MMQIEWEEVTENRQVDYRQKASIVVEEEFGQPGRKNEISVPRPVTAPQANQIFTAPPVSV